MIDINLIRENPELVKENIRKKFQDEKLPMVDEVREFDKENREVKQKVISSELTEIRCPRPSAS